MWQRKGITAIVLALGLTPARGQFPRDGEQLDQPVAPAARREVIEGVLRAIGESYVFPDKAKEMDRAIRAKMAAGGYDAVTRSMDLAATLTKDLQAICHDKHVRVRASAESLPHEDRQRAGPSPTEMEEMRKNFAARNFGFEKVERLEGNVGYLDLRGFMPVEIGGDTAAAAMNFLANADALIIDLRQNGGGTPGMVALVCSYLFPAEPVHLNDLYFRPDDSTHQWWTLAYVPGKRFLDKPVYVLTSGRTFSAAEECAYNLQSQKRATIVGETTGGGAHPGGMRRVSEHFAVFVPSGRAINPVTKTNWEGTGVKPDIRVSAALALKTAHLAALDKLADRKKGSPDAAARDRLRHKLRKELDEAKAGSHPTAMPTQP